MEEDLEETDVNRFTIDTKPIVGLTFGQEVSSCIIIQNKKRNKIK